MSIFDRCHHSSAVVTPIKYGCDKKNQIYLQNTKIQKLTDGLVTPTPGAWIGDHWACLWTAFDMALGVQPNLSLSNTIYMDSHHHGIGCHWSPTLWWCRMLQRTRCISHASTVPIQSYCGVIMEEQCYRMSTRNLPTLLHDENNAGWIESISWILMPWLLTLPGYQQPWSHWCVG